MTADVSTITRAAAVYPSPQAANAVLLEDRLVRDENEITH